MTRAFQILFGAILVGVLFQTAPSGRAQTFDEDVCSSIRLPAGPASIGDSAGFQNPYSSWKAGNRKVIAQRAEIAAIVPEVRTAKTLPTGGHLLFHDSHLFDKNSVPGTRPARAPPSLI